MARSSPEEMTRYAVAHACLAVVADGASLQSSVTGSAFPWKAVPGSFALYWTTPDHLKVDDHGGCYFRIDRGDPAKLRLAVLDALNAAGAAPGRFRQERYCLTGLAAGDRTLVVVISSGTGQRPPLQLSLLAAVDGRCSQPKSRASSARLAGVRPARWL